MVDFRYTETSIHVINNKSIENVKKLIENVTKKEIGISVPCSPETSRDKIKSIQRQAAAAAGTPGNFLLRESVSLSQPYSPIALAPLILLLPLHPPARGWTFLVHVEDEQRTQAWGKGNDAAADKTRRTEEKERQMIGTNGGCLPHFPFAPDAIRYPPFELESAIPAQGSIFLIQSDNSS